MDKVFTTSEFCGGIFGGAETFEVCIFAATVEDVLFCTEELFLTKFSELLLLPLISESKASSGFGLLLSVRSGNSMRTYPKHSIFFLN